MATVNLDEEFGSGWSKWNLQAWVDFFVIRTMMGRVGDVIPKTYVPILRLVAEDGAKVDDEYHQLVALRDPVRLFDSPRDKWRKLYGSYVRELDWVYDELRKYFPKHEYQDLVVDIMARTIKDALGAMLPTVEKGTRRAAERDRDPNIARRKSNPVARWLAHQGEKMMVGAPGRWLMAHANPMNGIIGPADMKFLPDGNMEIYIPRCWMHTAPGDGRTQDQACLWGCKGACEEVFGPESIAPMYFEPHLPDFSCTLTVKLGGAG
ncbi:MAG: hypothetical protein JRG80_07100 [Deltaproteobacteria bacterium]|nr:hypothetical protein [Deltaproteobacteria bacterium]MBW2399026.1 hypothetical protein [Deltaproteobacteria bacterium]MBW2666198.1 hypothetical protein [Deltaproteobacteria bacterium]